VSVRASWNRTPHTARVVYKENNSERPGTLPVSVLLQRAPVLLASIHLLSYFIFVVFND
jgi:hypothetical protein